MNQLKERLEVKLNYLQSGELLYYKDEASGELYAFVAALRSDEETIRELMSLGPTAPSCTGVPQAATNTLRGCFFIFVTLPTPKPVKLIVFPPVRKFVVDRTSGKRAYQPLLNWRTMIGW